MRVYRFQNVKYANNRNEILSGEGSRLFGGRWNKAGFPLVYTAATPELALHELMIHMKSFPPFAHNLVVFEIPDNEIESVELSALPEGWRSYQNYSITRSIAKDWIISRKSLVFKVPSAIVPMSNNYLINPLHPNISNVKIISSEPFVFDERIVKKPSNGFMVDLFVKMVE